MVFVDAVGFLVVVAVVDVVEVFLVALRKESKKKITKNKKIEH